MKIINIKKQNNNMHLITMFEDLSLINLDLPSIFVRAKVILFMKHFTDLTKKEALGLKGFLTDIDDTITLDGKLTNEGFTSLWKAYNAGLIVVPVTGRPAGWCDMVARLFPVQGVIGENGAFYFYMTEGKCKRYFFNTLEDREKNKEKLEIIKAQILKKHKGVRVASDQDYRVADLAIDYCEDVLDQKIDVAKDIKKVFESNGAIAKISSIHVNGWFGDYDKLSTTKHFFKSVINLDLEKHREEFAFFGDSPNDCPMFDFFPISFAVGDIEKYGEALTSQPKYRNKKRGGESVLEIINHILKMRE